MIDISSFIKPKTKIGLYNITHVKDTYNTIANFVKDNNILFKDFPDFDNILKIIESRINWYCIEDNLTDEETYKKLFTGYITNKKVCNILDDAISLLMMPFISTMVSSDKLLQGIEKIKKKEHLYTMFLSPNISSSLTKTERNFRKLSEKTKAFYSKILDSDISGSTDYVMLLSQYFEEDFCIKHLKLLEENNLDYIKLLQVLCSLVELLYKNINGFTNSLSENNKSYLKDKYCFVREDLEDRILLVASESIYKVISEYIIYNPEIILEIMKRNEDDIFKF